MIPEIDDILAGLQAGTYSLNQAQIWIEKHFEMAKEDAETELRDLFAMEILGGICAKCEAPDQDRKDEVYSDRVVAAYEMADIAMRVRNQ